MNLNCYHTERHNAHFNKDYDTARAKIAISKFFSGFGIKGRILDSGCGLDQNIYKLPCELGYDLSKFGIEYCKKKVNTATSHLQALSDETIDMVLSAHIFERHPNPKEMLGNIFSKLKKGFTLILVILYELRGKAQYMLDLNQHLFIWNFQTINNLLLTTGFIVMKNKYLRGAKCNK
jgi:SAM-dependent methyltransferase